MKKFLVILLSLAVLFGFAACDNSSSTPSGEDQTSSTVNDGVIDKAIVGLVKAMNGSDSSVSALMFASKNIMAEEDVTVTTEAPYTTLTVNKAINPAGEAMSAESVSLVIEGIDTKDGNDNGLAAGTAYPIALNRFTYTYNGNVLNAQGQNVPFTASVKGYFADSATAVVYTDQTTKKLNYTITASSLEVILPESSADITLTIGNEAVTDRIGYAFDKLAGSTITGVTTYANYMKDVDGTEGNLLDSYVGQLVDVEADTSIFTVLTSWLAADPTTGSNPVINPNGYEVSYANGTATIKFSPVGFLTLSSLTSGTANTNVLVGVARDEVIEITFSTDETVSGNFDPKTYTITGDFVAVPYTATTAPDVTDEDVLATGKTFSVDLAGDVETASGTAMNIVLKGENGIQSITVNDSTLEKAGTVSANVAKGPLLVPEARTAPATGNDAVLESGDVSITYPYTTYEAN